MKKIYSSPVVKEINITIEQNVLAGSLSVNVGTSGAYDDEEIGAKADDIEDILNWID